MRVCFVATNTFALNAFLASPIEALAAAGWKITVALNTVDGEVCELIRRNASVVPLRMKRHISPLADLPVMLDLWRLCRRERFDVIHSITPKGGVIAMTTGLLAGTPVRMHTFTGQLWVTRHGVMRAFLKFMERYVASCASHVLADSPSQAEFMVSHGIVAARHIEVLASGSICGVDTHRFLPQPLERIRLQTELDLPSDSVVILYVGRLHPEKGLAELGRAFARVAARDPRVRLVLVGPDEGGWELLDEGVAPVRSRVHPVGRQPDPQRYMAAADVFCLPSYREGFGMTLVEAAAAGLPAVATRIYGITDAVVDGYTGLLVPPRDATALATALERLVRDDGLRRRLGRAARERAVQMFGKEVVLAAWLNLYAEQAARAGLGPPAGTRTGSVEAPRT